MIVFPNCKINLGLSITEKRKDGYHNLESVFLPLPLKDVLEITPSKSNKSEFNSSGIEIKGDFESNLVFKAYLLLKEDYQIPSVKIHLHKAIPMGAGLGGGSSDAAFTLKLLNKLFELGIEEAKLLDYASKLGADCPFFIKNEASYAQGIGELLEPFSIDLSNKYILLAKPDVHISTVNAFGGIRPSFKNVALREIVNEPIDVWKSKLINDFEEPIFKQHPILHSIKNEMYQAGALYASMSGSGSTIYGIFNQEVKQIKKFDNCFQWSCKL